jgi:hypothetical protein
MPFITGSEQIAYVLLLFLLTLFHKALSGGLGLVEAPRLNLALKELVQLGRRAAKGSQSL